MSSTTTTHARDPREMSTKARRLRNAVEPIAGIVYFAQEIHDEFTALGFGPGVGGGEYLTLADLSGYYCSRAGCMGQVPGEVVVAAFGVFNPKLIIPAVTRGWTIAGVDAVLAARERGATAALTRILGTPDALPRATELLARAAAGGCEAGRFLYSGLRSLPVPTTAWGAAWRHADCVREHRGDSHIASWIAAGLDPIEAGLMAEAYYGMPTKRYHSGRGWTPSDLDAGLERLRADGLIDGDPVALTERGRELRESIEVSTDIQQRPILDALGDDYDELLSLVEPWAGAIFAAGEYPSSIEQLPPDWGRLDDPRD
ncbi:MAG: hypothetical protein JWM12_1597 [Ilumatobacteraceae bacterium]|nr:hypothetical protein [Ilumatobacteraceae bacterium]